MRVLGLPVFQMSEVVGSRVSGDEMVNKTLSSLCEIPLLVLFTQVLRHSNEIIHRFPVLASATYWIFSLSLCREDIVLELDQVIVWLSRNES